ncbi:MAG: hypothetical protein AAGI53_10760 [Planctomycetota bacterium]
MERAKLVKLGQAGTPWRYLRAASNLGIDGDPGLVYLTALNLADAGVPSLAKQILASLSGPAASAPPTQTLAERLEHADGSLRPLADRTRQLRLLEGVITLGGVPQTEARAAIARFVKHESSYEHHLASDGTEIRVASGSTDPKLWLGSWRDGESIVPGGDALDGENTPPITIEGLHAPSLVLEVANATPPLASGFWRGLRLVEPSIDRLLTAALTHKRLIDVLKQPRFVLFFGSDAGPRFSSYLAARSNVASIGPHVGTPTEANATHHLHVAARESSALASRVRSSVEVRDTARALHDWRRVYQEAATGARRLRVLIPTCRFSTYLQHSSKLLADAFRRAGHDVQVLIEPDASTNLSDASYLDACQRLDPDLIVLINFPRASRAGWFPKNVPFVCWIQDHMPHLYDPAIARKQGTLDFTMGHVPTELYYRIGYPTTQALATPVVIDPLAFHNGPVNPALQERFACDIAYVSHQSEPFEAMAERLASEIQPVEAAPAVHALVPRVRDALDRLVTDPLTPALREAVAGALNSIGVRDDPQGSLNALFTQAAAWPLAERLVRHRTLEWAADLADREGLCFKVFGSGWENHPRLARYASGPVGHGEELRACYASAKLHLHPTVRALNHQRVLECALSGGCILANYYFGALGHNRTLAAHLGLRPDDCEPTTTDGVVAIHRADHAELLRDAVERQELGLPVQATIEVKAEWLEIAAGRARIRDAELIRPTRLFPALRPYVFTDRSDFEQRVTTRVLGEDSEHAAWSDLLRQRVRATFTNDALVNRLIGFLADRLPDAQASSPDAETAA